MLFPLLMSLFMGVPPGGDACTPAPSGADCVALCDFKHTDPQGGIIRWFPWGPIPSAIPDTVTLSPGENFVGMTRTPDCFNSQVQSIYLKIFRDNELWGTCPPFSTFTLTETGYYTFTWHWAQGFEFFDNNHHYYLQAPPAPAPIEVVGGHFTVTSNMGSGGSTVTVASEGPTMVAATLFHVSGVLVHSWSNLPVSPEPTLLPIYGRVAGIYLLVIESAGERSMHKVWLDQR